MKFKGLPRRTFLRGAGSVAIALPFLEEMTVRRVQAQTRPPERLVTSFFGLGLDPAWQTGFTGPLEPYAPFKSKMATFSVDLDQAKPEGAHCETSTIAFVGEVQQSENQAGGPSIDQLLRSKIDKAAPTLASGLWWRRGACDAQALRVYDLTGTARPPVKRPSEVFDRVFGSYTPPSTEPDPSTVAEQRQARIRRSVLDTVMDQYRHLKGDASYLGQDSKLKLDQHLTSIREVETQLAPADQIVDSGDGSSTGSSSCDVPTRPNDPNIADYDRFTYGTGSNAPTMPWQDFQKVYRLHADLWAIAMRCDLLRYGNLMFESAGGHTNFSGTYSAMGQSTSFPGDSQHDSYFHSGDRYNARLYQHFAQSNLAYFLSQLDDTAFPESNGATVLDNATVVIGTEYGWNHDKRNAFHAVVGGGGRFRSGQFTNHNMNCVSLYNAILQGYGVQANIGSGIDPGTDAASLLLA